MENRILAQKAAEVESPSTLLRAFDSGLRVEWLPGLDSNQD
jgi:hypothetical protein